MSRMLPFYDLYCINTQCRSSIFNKTDKLISNYQVGPKLSVHICPVCHNTLVSALDIEMEQMTLEAKVLLAGQATALRMASKLN